VVTEIKQGTEWRSQAIRFLERHPSGLDEALRRKDAATSTSPLSRSTQARCQILQPPWLYCHVVIHESQNLAPRLSNPRVQGVRFALLRFEKVTKTAWIPAAKLLDNLARPIARIVIHHQNFPRNRFG
jgi:hypothetical protein